MHRHQTSDGGSDSGTRQRSGKVGAAVGAAGGIAAGALVGSAAGGPAGAMVGAAAGAVAGGLGMRALVEGFDTTPVDKHWRDRFDKESYYESGLTYDDYAPAYRLGAAARARYPAQSFEDTEAAMETEYPHMQGESRLAWDRARKAARASFHTEYF